MQNQYVFAMKNDCKLASVVLRIGSAFRDPLALRAMKQDGAVSRRDMTDVVESEPDDDADKEDGAERDGQPPQPLQMGRRHVWGMTPRGAVAACDYAGRDNSPSHCRL
jgi:hypothetical protein